MFRRLLLLCAAVAIISASSTAMAGFPSRWGYRSYYAPPVVRHYAVPRVYSYRVPAYGAYYAPYRSYYYGAPVVRSYYGPAYVPVAPYGGGVSVVSPGVSLRIGF